MIPSTAYLKTQKTERHCSQKERYLVPLPAWTLEECLANVPEPDVSRAVATGLPVGKEVQNYSVLSLFVDTRPSSTRARTLGTRARVSGNLVSTRARLQSAPTEVVCQSFG